MLVAAFSIAALIAAWSVLLVQPFSAGIGQDFTTDFVGALALWHGANPCCSTAPALYAAQLHVFEQGVNETPPILVLTSPFLLYSPRTAYVLYSAAQYLLVLSGAAMLSLLLPRSDRVALVAVIMASPAAFLMGYYGQPLAVVFLCAALAVYARVAGRWQLLGVCVAATLVKPQIGVCAALPLLWGARRQSWKMFATSVVMLVAGTFGLLGVHGAWAYLQTLRRFTGYAHEQAKADGLGISSLYGGWLTGPIATWIGTGMIVLLLLCVVALLARWRTKPSNDALAALSLLATLLSPYSHQYDSIALFPTLVLAFAGRDTAGVLPSRLLRHLKTGAGNATARLTLWIGIVIILFSPFMAISAVSVAFRLYPAGILIVLAELWRCTPGRGAAVARPP